MQQEALVIKCPKNIHQNIQKGSSRERFHDSVIDTVTRISAKSEI